MRTIGLLALAILILPISAHAALININTAVATTLEDLPGVGPSTAASIIANRPYASIEDISRADGIGAPGSSSYEKIKGLITVGDTSESDTTDIPVASTTDSSVQEQTSSSSSSSGSAVTSTPPSALTLDAGSNQNATMDVPLHLSARATIKGGAVDSSARIVWGFGDGSSAEGSAVEKTYRYAGAYLVVVTATDGVATGRDEFVVTVRPAHVRILGIFGTGIMIANDASERLDLSGSVLFADKGSFRVPNGTVILPKESVVFPSTVTKLLSTLDVKLVYPDGVIAAHYIQQVPDVSSVSVTENVTASGLQPSVPVTSFSKAQTAEPLAVSRVEPIISTRSNIQKNDEAVVAPADATELAAAGAALPFVQDTGTPKTKGLFSSPWFLSLIGVVALAGSAFIFL